MKIEGEILKPFKPGMTLQEAIDVLTAFRRQESPLLGDEFAQATALLIEAGKRVLYQRTPGGVTTPILLPGETKE